MWILISICRFTGNTIIISNYHTLLIIIQGTFVATNMYTLYTCITHINEAYTSDSQQTDWQSKKYLLFLELGEQIIVHADHNSVIVLILEGLHDLMGWPWDVTAEGYSETYSDKELTAISWLTVSNQSSDIKTDSQTSSEPSRIVWSCLGLLQFTLKQDYNNRDITGRHLNIH